VVTGLFVYNPWDLTRATGDVSSKSGDTSARDHDKLYDEGFAGPDDEITGDALPLKMFVASVTGPG
jgi:hypothetical protein